jgi:uncharacterized membrane protein
LWCAGFLLLPLAGAAGDALAGHVYGRVCHQLDERSFGWGSLPWAVCIRCSSIYLAFTATMILVPLIRGLERWTPMPPRVFAAWMVPAVLDAALSLSGLHPAGTATRLLTGTLAGVGLGLTVPPLFIDALTRGRRNRMTLHTGDHDVR